MSTFVCRTYHEALQKATALRSEGYTALVLRLGWYKFEVRYWIRGARW